MRIQFGGIIAPLLLVAGLIVSGCATNAKPVKKPAELTNNVLFATLYMQTAAEYKASAIQTYNAASAHIDNAITDKSWTGVLEQGDNFADKPPAIVLDVDETVLDNSPYAAKKIQTGTTFTPASWDAWVAMKSAPAIPGAVAFIEQVQAKGVEVIFVTNRACKARPGNDDPCPQKQDTLDNLISAGFKATNKTLFLKQERPEWTSEKKSRREFIAKDYRVVMLFGDDFGDFLPDVKKNITADERAKLVSKYQSNWGTKWFVLINPTYGSWFDVLDKPVSKHLKSY